MTPTAKARNAARAEPRDRVRGRRRLCAAVGQADVLIRRTHGRRPVTLLGYSMGARVIDFCLKELAARNAAGIVEDGALT